MAHQGWKGHIHGQWRTARQVKTSLITPSDRAQSACTCVLNMGLWTGDPQSILSALDHYGSKVRFLMNVGDSKGPILKGLLDKYQPKFIVELG